MTSITTPDRLSAIRQESQSESSQIPPRSSSPFPAEIVLDCLEALVSHVCESDDFPSAYTSLANCAQVSKLWHAPAQKVLLSYVEVVRREQAVSLFQALQQQHKGDSVRNLVIGVGMTSPGQHLIDAALLHDILVTCSQIRKLVLIHHDLPALRRGGDCDSSVVPDLPELTDVTILPSGWKSSSDIELDFLRNISSVRFLQLPCSEVNRTLPSDTDLTPPAFQLFGISAHSISPLVTWALLSSGESLQCLTVAYMGDIEPTAQAYPNIRSLRILTRISTTDQSRLDAFEHLERFEIRDLSASPSIIHTLPPSTSYIRLWSTELAKELCKMMQEDTHPQRLETIVWDWHSPTGGSNDNAVREELMKVMDDLTSACSLRGVELRALERRDGRRASQVCIRPLSTIDHIADGIRNRAKTYHMNRKCAHPASKSSASRPFPSSPKTAPRTPRNFLLESFETCTRWVFLSHHISSLSRRSWIPLLDYGRRYSKTALKVMETGLSVTFPLYAQRR